MRNGWTQYGSPMPMEFNSLQRNAWTSGMGVDDTCKTTFQELRQRDKRHSYIIFKVHEVIKKIVVEKIGRRGTTTEITHNDFINSLPVQECRYAVYDFDGKIFFIAWTPSTAGFRSKVLYRTSKDKLRQEFEGIDYELDVTDSTDKSIEAFRNPARLSITQPPYGLFNQPAYSTYGYPPSYGPYGGNQGPSGSYQAPYGYGSNQGPSGYGTNQGTSGYGGNQGPYNGYPTPRSPYYGNQAPYGNNQGPYFNYPY